MRLKTRVLIETLSAALAAILLLSAVFFISLGRLRNLALANSRALGDGAAGSSFSAMEEQEMNTIVRLVSDMALILDEKLIKIENHTMTTADITSSIYTHREAWRPKPLYRVPPGELSPSEPYLHAAPGVELSQIQREADLAGNIGDMLRQITVIDRGITTSTIGGESGYIIAMDAYPWPQTDFDPRLYSWYIGAKERGDLFWTPVYADLRGRGPAISCAMPFYDASGEERVFKGVARSTVILKDFTRMIAQDGVGRTGYVFLVDQSGMKLFSSGHVDVWYDEGGAVQGQNYLESSDPHLRSLGMSMTLGAVGVTELEIDGVPVYAAYAPVLTLGWSLGVAIPIQEIIEPARLINDQILSLTAETAGSMNRHIFFMAGLIGVMLFLILAAAAFLSVRFTEAITAPILSLNTAVQEVSAGNLEREVRVKTGDELEQLALSFNTMTVRLRDHIAEIARAAAEKERSVAELRVAAQIQASMLPGAFSPPPGGKDVFDVYAAIHPAKEVGGDFYDFFFIDEDHFVFLVADVSGKGVPAALFMALTKSLIKNRLQAGEGIGNADISDAGISNAGIGDALGNVNRQLCNNNTAGMFVTLWLGILEVSSRRLYYVNGGHNSPLLKTKGRPFSFLASRPDLFLAGMEDTVYHCREARLQDGDTLFLYTDGVTEAADNLQDLYGGARLRQFLDAHESLPIRELLPALRSDIGVFSQGAEVSDDMTMLALRIKDPPQN